MIDAVIRAQQQITQPAWTREVTTSLSARICHQFVLHFNITDRVIDLAGERLGDGLVRDARVVGKPLAFRDYLYAFLRGDRASGRGWGCQAVYTYSLAGGIMVEEPGIDEPAVSPKMMEVAWKRVHTTWEQLRTSQDSRKDELPERVSDNLKVLGHILRHQYGPQGEQLESGEVNETPVAVVLDYAEKLVPFRVGDGQGDRDQLQALETVQRWALDSHIRQTLNVVIILTTNQGQIPASVYAAGSGCRAIRIQLPNQAQREAFIWYLKDRPPEFHLDPDTFGPDPVRQVAHLAHLTQGLRLSDIDNMRRRILTEYQGMGTPSITARDVQEEKAKAIQAQSEQLLEILEPRRGFDEIGGLEQLKEYLKTRATQMGHRSKGPMVPSGLLLCGPPGTGKTIVAEALAKESNFNLVKMRNIRDRWVGSSERNLDLVINLLDDLYPVVVFIDEIDQAVGQRETGQNGDSGVGARMFGRILEVMGDPSRRGKTLWVAATNRADVLDAALLRRFDRVVPLLTPDEDEVCRIFVTMPAMIASQSDDTVHLEYAKDLVDGLRNADPAVRTMARTVAELGLTGAAVEIIVRRAAEIACEDAIHVGLVIDDQNLPVITREHIDRALADFKPNHDPNMYDLQSLLAIRACNFYSVIPRLGKRPIFESVLESDGKIDPTKLDAAIQTLEARLGVGRAFRGPPA